MEAALVNQVSMDTCVIKHVLRIVLTVCVLVIMDHASALKDILVKGAITPASRRARAAPTTPSVRCVLLVNTGSYVTLTVTVTAVPVIF